MKAYRLLIISVVLLFVLVTAISLFIPSHVVVSRAINLAPGSDSILSKINDISQWPGWYPGLEQVTLKEKVTVDGRVVKANANGIRIAITAANDSLVSVEMLRGARPVRSGWQLIHYSASDSLTLRNFYEFDFNWYPWEKFSSLLLDKSYGPVMEQGLKQLKSAH